MTLATTGQGKLAFRLEIEGIKYQFVTDPAMTQVLADGRERVAGLLRKGVVIGAEVDIPRAKLTGKSIKFRIADLDGKATEQFAFSPTVITEITADMTAAATSIGVLSSNGITTGDYIYMNSETLQLSGKTSTSLSFSPAATKRGVWGSLAQKHWYDEGSQFLTANVHAANPPAIEGRRAYLYVYEDGDDLAGDGTLRWRGVCSTDAEQTNAVEWEILVDPITRLLAQKLGTDFSQEITTRGIYYPSIYGLKFECLITRYVVTAATSTDSVLVSLAGFWESQNDWVSALNTATKTVTSAAGWTSTISAAVLADGTWSYQWSPDTASNEYYFDFEVDNKQDGRSSVGGTFDLTDNAHFYPTNGFTATTATHTYLTQWGDNIEGARTEPRGAIGGNRGRELFTNITFSAVKVYLAPSGDISQADSVTTILPEGTSQYFPIPGSQPIAVDSDENSLKLSIYTNLIQPYNRELPMKFILSKHYATGSVYEFLTAVIASTPSFINNGSAPFLTSEEFGLSDFQEVVQSASSDATSNRQYDSREVLRLDDYLAEEFKLLGVFPVYNSTGQIILQNTRHTVDTVVPVVSFDSSSILRDQRVPTLRKNATFGSLSALTYFYDYDVLRNEFRRKASFQTSTGVKRVAGSIDVKPRSSPADPRDDTLNSVSDNFLAMLSIFSNPYYVIELDVPLTAIGVKLGDVVGITDASLPNIKTGTRGVTNAKAIVFAQLLDLERGRGTLKCLLNGQSVAQQASYAPSFGLSTQTNLTGNTWRLTLLTTDPYALVTWMPDGSTVADYLETGMQINIREWGSSGPSDRRGEVVSVSGMVATVTLDSVWTPGANPQWITYDVASQSPTTEQKRYAYWAGSDGLIAYNTGDEAGKRFS